MSVEELLVLAIPDPLNIMSITFVPRWTVTWLVCRNPCRLRLYLATCSISCNHQTAASLLSMHYKIKLAAFSICCTYCERKNTPEAMHSRNNQQLENGFLSLLFWFFLYEMKKDSVNLEALPGRVNLNSLFFFSKTDFQIYLNKAYSSV